MTFKRSEVCTYSELWSATNNTKQQRKNWKVLHAYSFNCTLAANALCDIILRSTSYLYIPKGPLDKESKELTEVWLMITIRFVATFNDGT